MYKQTKQFLILIITIISGYHLHSQTKNIDFQQKHVLLVYGGWDGHQPEAFGARMSTWFKKHNAKVTEAKKTNVYANEKLMSTVDFIVQSITMSEIPDKDLNGLRKAIEKGVGFAGCHGGLGDSFRDNTEYQYIVGGQFVKHPGDHINHKIHFIDLQDPTVEGLSNFEIYTEQYYMHIDPNVKVLATTQFSGAHDSWIKDAVIPVSWKKYHGQGRIFFCTLGHAPEVFEHPIFWEHFTRGIEWAAESKFAPKEDWLEPVYSILPKKNSDAFSQ
ncbi:MAG: ThuA domain-containing protein [Flavobacteriaceae bacterium]|nr:ThuA domain-containing protein [Flavobacteriaceae bacterium]